MDEGTAEIPTDNHFKKGQFDNYRGIFYAKRSGFSHRNDEALMSQSKTRTFELAKGKTSIFFRQHAGKIVWTNQ
jgi:hypothetical protein